MSRRLAGTHSSMYTPLLIGLALLLLALAAVWARSRLRHIRAASRQREEDALQRLRNADPATDGDTMFGATGLPSQMPAQRGIEVAEHDAVDLEALLAGEEQGVARRARATLEEPTNIFGDAGIDTLPPVMNGPRAAPAPTPPAVVPPRASGPAAPAPAAAAVRAPIASAAPAAAVRTAEPARRVPAAPAVAPATVPTLAAAPRPASRPVLQGGTPIRDGDDVSLRELALAWFEARGYRSAPASAAVRPIEQVLRHRHDPARAYAFVVEDARVTPERVQQLRAQARSIGLLRVLIVANGGADASAATKSKGVRLMDRASLAAEFDQLDFSVAAKIYAVARKRSTLAAAPS